jgi:hypothetical protein
MHPSLEARLNRSVVGERQMMVHGTVMTADERMKRESFVKDRVPKPRKPLTTGKTRSARGQPACEPNAPQLIRLVQSPYSVTPTFNKKLPSRDRLSERDKRVPYHEQITEALNRPAMVGLPGIHREYPAAPAPRLWSLKDPS